MRNVSANEERPSGWIRCEKLSADEKIRLFCFPYAGGGASAFVPWKPHLPEYISMLPVQLPGHEDRYGEEPVTNIDTLCEALCEGLEPWFTGNMAFWGHSMGGLLAFCLTRHMAKKGMTLPCHLFISAAPTPIPPEVLPPEATGEKAFLDRILQSEAVPDSVLLDADSLEVVKRTLLVDNALLHTMIDGSREKVNVPFTVMYGDRDLLVTRDRVELWKAFTTGICDFIAWPGGHFYLRRWYGEVIERIDQTLLLYAM